MDKPTKGIPTVYKGIQFRSRLEARWAAMFDLLEWPWQYEPFDLDGWIPDFILTGKHPVLVEVKPVVSFPVDIASEIEAAILPSFTPAIVGCALIGDTVRIEENMFPGLLGWSTCPTCGTWLPFGAGKFNAGSSAFGLFLSRSCELPFDFVSGRDCEDSKDFHWPWNDITLAWNRAGNLTQWRGKQSIVQS